MVDTVDSATRRRMMQGIGTASTAPELRVRSLLHRQGFRYRLNVRTLPGKPDIVLPRWRAVVMVHGCFWHGHECALFKWPATRPEFWATKIGKNRDNDRRTGQLLQEAGWRVATVWECALKGRNALPDEVLAQRLGSWLRSVETGPLQIAG